MKTVMKTTAVLVCALILFSGVLFANGNDESKAQSDINLSAPGVLPVTDTPVTFRIYAHTRLGVDNYEENAYTQWLEEKTGLNLDFIVAPEQQSKEKLNVIMSSGDYPDIITGYGVLTPAQIKLYGEQGILTSLNDYIETQGVETKKVLTSYPAAREIITMPDGNIYALPDINDCYHCSMATKMWIYQPWLDTLGLDTPTTTDEYYRMLMAFKEQDPNGNGTADEIPLMGASNGWNAFPEQFIMNSFVYYDSSNNGLYLQDGRVSASFTQEGWKQGLSYMNKLYSDGLLAGESFTQDNKILKQNAESETPIVGSIPSGYMGMFCQLSVSDRWKDFKALAPLEGPEGVRYAAWLPYSAANMKLMITSTCEHPEAAFKMADFMYTPEATHSMVSGRKGIEWDFLSADSGIIGINGKPAEYQVLVPVDEQPSNVSWNQLAIGFRSSDVRQSAALNEAIAFEGVLVEETRDKYQPYIPELSQCLPPIAFSEQQTTRLLPIETTVNNYVKEMIARFVIGDLDIESNWDSYLAELENMGLSRMLKIYQEAYEG